MKFYRYESYWYQGGAIQIYLLVFYLIKETPCGYWVSSDPNYNDKEIHFICDKKRWVSKTAVKRLCYPTKKQALINFAARKRRQIDILENRLIGAKLALQKVSCETDEILKMVR